MFAEASSALRSADYQHLKADAVAPLAASSASVPARRHEQSTLSFGAGALEAPPRRFARAPDAPPVPEAFTAALRKRKAAGSPPAPAAASRRQPTHPAAAGNASKDLVAASRPAVSGTTDVPLTRDELDFVAKRRRTHEAKSKSSAMLDADAGSPPGEPPRYRHKSTTIS